MTSFYSILKKNRMKKYILCLALLAVLYSPLIAQDIQTQDSTATQNLDEVLVKAVRVQPNAPITHSNVTKKDIAKRNLGQDIPGLNFLVRIAKCLHLVDFIRTLLIL